VDASGFYRVELDGADGASGPASLDYTIDVIPDRPPTVAVAEPGRDARVTSLEELFTSIEAEDDYGVARVDVVYTVNGGPEQVVRLHESGARRTPEVTAGHTFFLEEFGLKPGDVVSYYARARDNDAVSGAHTAATDIYFLQVRPFDQIYRQAEQSGGGGGQADESPNALSERQRQIVSATFKLVRDRAETAERQRREDLTTLALAQGRIREQVSRLSQRMAERGGAAVGADSSLREIAAALGQATAEMQAAEEQLGRRRPDDALPAAQRALQQLLRAEAAFREVQVSMGGDPSGGGGGGSSSPEELADLFGLEADRMRNQYEAVQRGARRPRRPRPRWTARSSGCASSRAPAARVGAAAARGGGGGAAAGRGRRGRAGRRARAARRSASSRRRPSSSRGSSSASRATRPRPSCSRPRGSCRRRPTRCGARRRRRRRRPRPRRRRRASGSSARGRRSPTDGARAARRTSRGAAAGRRPLRGAARDRPRGGGARRG
jgi:hypothetical protein